MTAGNYATLFFIGLMLIAVEWMRLSVWAAGLFIFGTVLNGVGGHPSRRHHGGQLCDHAGRGALFAATSVRPHTAAHRGTARVNPFTTELPPT